jgi:colicin import membrane protein
MPGVLNETPAFDPVDYYTKQLPLELARLTELRDELRKRQGALAAVEEAQKDREAAGVELATAKSQAAEILADAKAADGSVKARAAALDERDAASARAAAEAANEALAREIAVTSRERAVKLRESAAAAKDQSLAEAAAKLDAERDAFNAKVAAFQSLAAQMKA